MNRIIKMGVVYGSMSHYILNYAKMRSRIGDGTFKVEDYHKFRQKSDAPYVLNRSVSTLVKHGHLQKIDDQKLKFTENGMMCVQMLQTAHSSKLSDELRKRTPSARALMAERDSEDV